jgi:catechol 2,3-dioxygenase-like lactoylglutathione lyase family enzyme
MPELLDHIDLRVRDRKAATRFYDAFLRQLGAVKNEGPEYTTWRVPPGSVDSFGIIEERALVAGSTRIAFRAPSRESVDAVAELLPGIGARAVEMDDGIYGDNYHGVFFEDPDGNQLEVCIQS